MQAHTLACAYTLPHDTIRHGTAPSITTEFISEAMDVVTETANNLSALKNNVVQIEKARAHPLAHAQTHLCTYAHTDALKSNVAQIEKARAQTRTEACMQPCMDTIVHTPTC